MMMFAQTKAIRLTDIAMTVAPAIALVTVWLQLSYLGYESLNTALAMSILLLSIPFQGYFMLGKQADSPLPQNLKSWYREIESTLVQQKVDLKAVKTSDMTKNHKLTYMDLAVILKLLFEK